MSLCVLYTPALQAQSRCLARLAAEVLAPLEQRLQSHEQLREALWQRQRLSKLSEAARDVATLRREAERWLC